MHLLRASAPNHGMRLRASTASRGLASGPPRDDDEAADRYPCRKQQRCLLRTHNSAMDDSDAVTCDLTLDASECQVTGDSVRVKRPSVRSFIAMRYRGAGDWARRDGATVRTCVVLARALPRAALRCSPGPNLRGEARRLESGAAGDAGVPPD